MKNNKLIRALEKLSRRDMTRFTEFVHSPYFNKHSESQHLVDYLNQIYPDFSDKKCNREVIFHHLYPALPHNQSKLAILFTYALRLLEQFLRMEQAVKQDFFNAKPILLQALRERSLLFLTKNNWRENIGQVKEAAGIEVPPVDLHALQDSHYIETRYRLAAEQDAVAMQLGQHDSGHLAEKQPWLDAWYVTEKLKDACEMHQRSALMKKKFEADNLLELISASVKEHPEAYEAFVPAAIYSRLYELLKNGDPAAYPATLDYIRERFQLLAAPVVQNIYNYLLNFCIRQINLGNPAFLRELFELYRFQLEQDLLLDGDCLPEWHYKNIVTTGLRLDEHEWVCAFLENYRQRLHPDAAENAYSFNLAAYFYHLKNYDEVLRLLLRVEYTDVRYNLDAKSMLLRTYYDLEADEALYSLTETFKQYLKRNKSISEFQQKGYSNLLKLTRRAYKLKTGLAFTAPQKWQDDLQKLQAALAEGSTVFNRSWLEEKLQELEGSV